MGLVSESKTMIHLYGNVWKAFRLTKPYPVTGNTHVSFKFKLTKEELHDDGFFTDYLRQEQKPIDGVTYWFHGTDRESALNIIKEGIDVNRGGKGLDFSDGAGFYLTR